jgi:hypothetical protein
VRHSPIPGFQLGFAVYLPIPQILGLPGATSHDLYPYALAFSAYRAITRGDFDHVEDNCRTALRAAGRLSSGHERRRVEYLETITQMNRLTALGRWRESALYSEEAATIAREDGREADVAGAFASRGFSRRDRGRSEHVMDTTTTVPWQRGD